MAWIPALLLFVGLSWLIVRAARTGEVYGKSPPVVPRCESSNLFFVTLILYTALALSVFGVFLILVADR